MKFGIYEVTESFTKDGLWKGYRCAATESIGKQGKLYPKSDDKDHYRSLSDQKPVEKGSSEDLEI